MGLLGDAAKLLCYYIRTRDSNQAVIDGLNSHCVLLQPELEDATKQLKAGEVPDPVILEFTLPMKESAGGRIEWGEEWVFPSADLLMSVNRDFAYDPRWSSLLPHPPCPWQGHLVADLYTEGHQMLVAIPLTSLPWTEPRGQIRWLKPSAKQFGKPVRKWEQEYLQPFKEPHPHLGQRFWRFLMHEATPVEEVLTHLVIVALKQRFPVSMEDQQMAWQWVQHIVQEGVRRLDTGESRQMSQDVIGDVFQALMTRFDLPATPWALQDFIKETARGHVLDERKKHPSRMFQEPWDDPASGERRYPDAWVAKDIKRSKRTVTRWKADHGITTEGLSETALTAIRQEYEPKKKRKRLWEIGKACGMSDDSLKKLFQRKRKLDGTLDWEAIEARIKRREKKAEAMALSEDTMSIKDQIAEWEARCDEALPGSDAWCDAQDALQQLRQLQQGSDT